jgi:hypothetical protein
MEHKKLKHSKFKNSGILFELLVQQVTSDILKGATTSSAKDILQKFFHENTYIGKELKLYQYILNEKIKTHDYANRLLETILDSRKKIPSKALAKEKYNLIKEIKDKYDIDLFLKGNVSNYKILASIYKLFENVASEEYAFDPHEIFQSKNCIIEHILSRNNPLPAVSKTTDKLFETYKKQDYDEKILTYKILVDSFNKKYKCLSEEQKVLLREYVNCSNTNSLKLFIESQIPKITAEMNKFIPRISNEVVKIKLNEAVSQLNNLKIGFNVKDNHITTMLLSYELLKELRDTIK